MCIHMAKEQKFFPKCHKLFGDETVNDITKRYT